MQGVIDRLHELGFELGAVRHGRVRLLCPECSAGRKAHNRRQRCVSMLIEDSGACWFCHNCSNRGGFRTTDKRESSYHDPKIESNRRSPRRPRSSWHPTGDSREHGRPQRQHAKRAWQPF